MTNKFTRVIFGLLLLASLAFSQTAVTSTTLSAAMDAKTKTLVVASATGIGNYPNLQQSQGAIGNSTGQTLTLLLVEREAMEVVSVSGTSVTVRRGQQGTRQNAHPSGAKVFVAYPGTYTAFDPIGSCTRALLPYVPVISLASFQLFDCVNGVYASMTTGGNSVGVALASATTIAPIGKITHVTGTTNVVNVTLPPSCPSNGCQIVLIPDAIWATTNAGNIAIATTAVVSKALILTYDSATSKWYPSY